MSKKMTYETANAELKDILQELEQDINIDLLTGKLERAKVLIGFCRDKLRSVELQVKDLFEEQESE